MRISHLPKRWHYFGFKQNPFIQLSPPLSEELIQALYVFYEKHADYLNDVHISTVLCAYQGNGKTITRKYYEYQFERKGDNLVVLYNSFTQASRCLPNIITLDVHTEPLMRSIMSAFLKLIIYNPQQQVAFIRQEPDNKQWWWSLIDTYLEKYASILLSEHDILKNSYNEYLKSPIKPFPDTVDLPYMLKSISQELWYFNRKRIVIFVDNLDGQVKNSVAELTQIIQPILQTNNLFSDRVLWKIFLPYSLSKPVKQFITVQGERVKFLDDYWLHAELLQKRDTLRAILNNRLRFFSGDFDFFPLELICDEAIKSPTETFLDIVLQSHTNSLITPQKTISYPQLLLRIGRILIKCTASDDRCGHLISPIEWANFLDSTQHV